MEIGQEMEGDNKWKGLLTKDGKAQLYNKNSSVCKML